MRIERKRERVDCFDNLCYRRSRRRGEIPTKVVIKI